jgi:hypothetical protein
MLNRKTKYAIWFAALAFVMACAPVLTSAPPPLATIDPNAVNRIIAQTANAASTQTAGAGPTSTVTSTPTRIPTYTKSVTPTVTNTVIFEFFTSTPVVLPPALATFKPASDKDYACEVLNSPVDGTYYDPRLEFNVRWRLKNVGQKEWDGGSVDFVYDTGDKIHKVKGYDLGDGVKIGEIAELFVEMRAPKDPGTYPTYWSLRYGTYKFCKVAFTIKVR